MKSTVAVALAILLGGLSGCSPPAIQEVDPDNDDALRRQQSALWTPMVEAELAKWTPDPTNLTAVLGPMLRPGMNIVGEWKTIMCEGGSSLQIAPSPGGAYSVALSTCGCEGRWDLRRTGTYRDGVLRLDRPVREYCHFAYDTLYAVSLEGRDYLLSQELIRFVVEHDVTNGVVDWAEGIKYFAFCSPRLIGARERPGGKSDGSDRSDESDRADTGRPATAPRSPPAPP